MPGQRPIATHVPKTKLIDGKQAAFAAADAGGLCVASTEQRSPPRYESFAFRCNHSGLAPADTSRLGSITAWEGNTAKAAYQDFLTPSCSRTGRAGSLEHQLIDVAPTPVLAGFQGSHDRVPRGMKMLGGVLVF